MAKPRVIIADEEAGFIIPLQFGFIKKFFNKLDLEIITDRRYFQEFFSVPQKAEILIVSEELYDESLKRHNISHVFVMMEEYEQGGTEDLDIHKLSKYTSIKEIFNEIVGKSIQDLNLGNEENKETQILLVTSASGGTGKTSVAVGLASCLSKNYKSVLYLNACRLQEFHDILKNDTPLASAEIYRKLANPTEQIYQEIQHVIRRESFSYLPAFKAALMSLGLKFSVFEKIALSAKKSREFDYILIDAESTFDEDKTRLLDIADKVLVITDQTRHTVRATNGFLANINGVNTDKYVFICNKFRKEKYNALLASDLSARFTVNEYVDYFEDDGSMGAEELSQCIGIRKTSFLLV